MPRRRPAQVGFARRSRLEGVRGVALAITALAGCSYPTDESLFPGECPPFALLKSEPAIAEQDVPTNVVIELAFSDYPDPDAASLDTIILTSGFFRRTGTYSVDLVGKKVRFRPTLPLDSDLEYTVSVQPHMRSIQGCTLGRLEQRSFRTAAGPQTDPPPRPAVSAAAVLSIFAQSCAGAGCHRDAPAGVGSTCTSTRPPRGLSLCEDRAFDDLVGVRSVEAVELRRVAPRDAARSYLMRKLLPGTLPGRPMPTTAGDIMPPSTARTPNGGLSSKDIRTIADWIDAGAPRE